MDNTNYIGQMVVVGNIVFGGKLSNVYYSLDDPFFKVSDIKQMFRNQFTSEQSIVSLCEQDEILQLPMIENRIRVSSYFVNERGFYNILSQTNDDAGRKWRRVVHDEIIRIRKEHNKNVKQQFEDWDHAADDIYFDERTGKMMQSVTIQGGDVIQVPIER